MTVPHCFLYGSEVLVTKNKNVSKIQGAEIKQSTILDRRTALEMFKNEVVRHELNIYSINGRLNI
jgi:hypothetical protein